MAFLIFRTDAQKRSYEETKLCEASLDMKGKLRKATFPLYRFRPVKQIKTLIKVSSNNSVDHDQMSYSVIEN